MDEPLDECLDGPVDGPAPVNAPAEAQIDIFGALRLPYVASLATAYCLLKPTRSMLPSWPLQTLTEVAVKLGAKLGGETESRSEASLCLLLGLQGTGLVGIF